MAVDHPPARNDGHGSESDSSSCSHSLEQTPALLPDTNPASAASVLPGNSAPGVDFLWLRAEGTTSGREIFQGGWRKAGRIVQPVPNSSQ